MPLKSQVLKNTLAALSIAILASGCKNGSLGEIPKDELYTDLPSEQIKHNYAIGQKIAYKDDLGLLFPNDAALYKTTKGYELKKDFGMLLFLYYGNRSNVCYDKGGARESATDRSSHLCGLLRTRSNTYDFVSKKSSYNQDWFIGAFGGGVREDNSEYITIGWFRITTYRPQNNKQPSIGA